MAHSHIQRLDHDFDSKHIHRLDIRHSRVINQIICASLLPGQRVAINGQEGPLRNTAGGRLSFGPGQTNPPLSLDLSRS